MSEFYRLILGWVGRPRNLQTLALIAASPVLTAVSLIYLLAVTGHAWSPDHQAIQLQLIRDGIMYVHLLLFVTIAALTAGLVRSFNLSMGKIQFNIDLADDYDGASNVAKTGMMLSAENVEEAKEISEIPPVVAEVLPTTTEEEPS